MKEGVTARDVYQHALNYVKEKRPELEKNFVRSVGHGVRCKGTGRSKSNPLITDGNGVPRPHIPPVCEEQSHSEGGNGLQLSSRFSRSD